MLESDELGTTTEGVVLDLVEDIVDEITEELVRELEEILATKLDVELPARLLELDVTKVMIVVEAREVVEESAKELDGEVDVVIGEEVGRFEEVEEVVVAPGVAVTKLPLTGFCEACT
jgi:hypothetical protein